jgi:protein TilB
LTLNFIPLKNLEESCRNLAQVPTIEQLYLTGNPCTDWDMYRKVVISIVPQLKQLDSKDITHTERLEAFQELPVLLDHLKIAIRDNLYEKHSAYTQEARIEMANENKKIQDKKNKEKEEEDEKQYGII